MAKIIKQKLLIATRNTAKLGEFREFLKDIAREIVSLDSVGVDSDVVEDGKTYEENSQKKALFFASSLGLPTIADDGGIEIEGLNGGPGLLSRRYFAPRSGVSLCERKEATDEEILDEMIKLSKTLPDDKRGARFITVVSFALPNGKVWSSSGSVKGVIAKKPFIKLHSGYPYRSFFFIPKLQKYYHEKDLTIEEMRTYNHRYKAVRGLRTVLLRELKIEE